MKERKAKRDMTELVLEYDLDAPQQKVWRAIGLPEFREKWLPEKDLVDAQPISSEPGEEISYAMKDKEPPFLESRVVFQLRPNDHGGTILRIVQELVDERLAQEPIRAANNNRRYLMQAA